MKGKKKTYTVPLRVLPLTTRRNPLMLPNLSSDKIAGNVWRPAANANAAECTCARASSSTLSPTPSFTCQGNDTIAGTSTKCPKGHPLLHIRLTDNYQIPESIMTMLMKVSDNETVSSEMRAEEEKKADEIIFGCGVCETQLILSQQAVSVCNVCSLFLCSRCDTSTTDEPATANESLTNIITPEHATAPQRHAFRKARPRQRLRDSWTASDDELLGPSMESPNPSGGITDALGPSIDIDNTDENNACRSGHVRAKFVHAKHSSSSSPPSAPRLRAHHSTDDDSTDL